MVASSQRKDTVLLIEDEQDVLDLVRYNLSKAGHRVIEAMDGLAGLRAAREQRPAAVILDLMLPEMGGEDVCRRLKEDTDTAAIPVIMLTAKAEERDRIAGLELGADDYMTKPFSPRELVLRLEAVLRRVAAGRSFAELVVEGPLEIDRLKQEARLDGEPLRLTPLEFKALAMLVDKRGKTIDRETLLREVWGYAGVVQSRTVDTHIRRLRSKLGVHETMIGTVHGEGYRLRATATTPTQ